MKLAVILGNTFTSVRATRQNVTKDAGACRSVDMFICVNASKIGNYGRYSNDSRILQMACSETDADTSPFDIARRTMLVPARGAVLTVPGRRMAST
eukprot:6195890-Pleurochrysis_carterae.AAC.3